MDAQFDRMSELFDQSNRMMKEIITMLKSRLTPEQLEAYESSVSISGNQSKEDEPAPRSIQEPRSQPIELEGALEEPRRDVLTEEVKNQEQAVDTGMKAGTRKILDDPLNSNSRKE